MWRYQGVAVAVRWLGEKINSWIKIWLREVGQSHDEHDTEKSGPDAGRGNH